MVHAIVKQYIAATIASLGFVMQGTALGWPSPILPRLQKGDPIHLGSSEITWMVSLLYAGNFISPIPSGYLMDKFGRKRVVIILSVVPLLGWIFVLFPSSAYMLYAARFMTGLWSGIANTVIPMYLGEISEPRIRGSLSTFVQLMTYVGVNIEYIVGPFVSYTTLAIVNTAIPVIYMCLFVWMPESPYWYMMKNDRDNAEKSLSWLRASKNSDAVQDEVMLIEKTVKEEMKNKKTFKDLFATSGNRKGMLIVQMLAIFQRMSGISGLMAYTSTTLPKDGIDPDECVIIMGLVWVSSVFVSTVLVDMLGRRPLLAASCVGGGLAMSLAAVWFFLQQKTDVDVSGTYWVPFASVLIYGFFFSIGLGPIASTVQGETFPSNTKGLASAITSISLAGTSFIMNKIYIPIEDTIGIYFNFVIFAASCVACLLFVIFYVIETKGKSLQEIQDQLNPVKKGRKTSKSSVI